MTGDRAPITCEWHGCGRTPDSDGLCERHARRDAGLRCDGGHEETDERSVSLSAEGLLEEALTQIVDDDALHHVRSALQHLDDDAVEHETDGDALLHGEIEAHFRDGRLRLLWKNRDTQIMLSDLKDVINKSDMDGLAWWGDPPVGEERRPGMWLNIDISDEPDEPDDAPTMGVDKCVHCGAEIDDGWCPDCDGENQIETDGGMHVRHRRIHIREQGNETDYPTGVGVEFPSGTVVVEWIKEAWPASERLDGAHQSVYSSLADLAQVVSGSIYVVDGDEPDPNEVATDGGVDIETDGGTDRLPTDCPREGCERHLETRDDALVHMLYHVGDGDEEIVTDGGTVVESAETTETSKVWDGPFVKRDRAGEPTGYRYVRCRACGVEVIEHEREHATHRDGCEHAVDRGDGVETDGGVEVPKQTVPEGAARLGFKSAADARTGAWIVASETDGDDVTITNDSGGWWTVEIDRRQSESCWIGRLETDEWVGVCSCTDYDPDDLSDSGRSWPCAELSVLRQQIFIGRIKLDESFDQIDPSALGGDD